MDRFLLILCTAVYLACPHTRAQTARENRNAMQDSGIQSFFDAQAAKHPEKLYLHLNQPYYGAGDTMWFKAYLTDAVSHRPDTLPAGEYTLRAYTGWMLNFEPAFFFRRNINVGNTRSDRIRTDVTYTSAQAIVRFADADGRPIRDAEADYELFDWNGKRIEGVRQRTSATGALFVDLPHDSIRNGGYIRMKLDEGRTAFRRTLFLEPEAHDFAVQFFPEGGELVAGVPHLVAFKAERADGYPEDVRGSVLDSRGDTVVSFVAEHDGMGTFLLCPLQGETYRAVCRAGEREIRATLPEVGEGACALTTAQAPGRILYKADGTVPPGSRLIGHIRGDCCCIVPVDTRRPAGTILTDSLPEGILHLLLVDSTGRPRSKRLVFLKRTEKRERWTATPKSPSTANGKRCASRSD